MDDRIPEQPDSQSPDDDEEYELEPLDPAIVAAEQRRAQEVAQRARVPIDIDAVYEEAEHNRGAEIVEGWLRNFKYRFHIKHVVMGTALLAIVVAIASAGYLVPAITVFVLGSLLSIFFYMGWEDRKHQQVADQKREEIYAQRRKRALSATSFSEATETAPPPLPEPAPVIAAAAEPATEPAPPEPFRIQFSLRSMIIAMTIAALTFGMIHALGGPGQTATILGLIAVAGLVIHALGFEPPQSVILGWWFILALYVLLTIAGAVWSSG